MCYLDMCPETGHPVGAEVTLRAGVLPVPPLVIALHLHLREEGGEDLFFGTQHGTEHGSGWKEI